jgi:hypothetical protein
VGGELVGKTAEEKQIVDSLKKEGWNDYVVIAEGNRCRLWVGQSRRFRDRHVKSGCRFRNRPAPLPHYETFQRA